MATRAQPAFPPAIPKATFFQLVFMIYAAVCGGAFGLEEMVSGAGPGLALAVLLLMPLAFSLPVTLVVAEMTARFPVEGGSYRWAGIALGDFWAAQSGWWTWLTGALMNTLYAVLFVSYAKQAFTGITGIWEWVLAVALIWLAYYLNLKGVNLVGNAAIIFTVLLLLPFVMMTALGLDQWKFNPAVPFFNPSQSALAGLHSAVAISIWLYAGYEKLSAAAEETVDPQRNFPRGLLLATVFATLSYVLPTVAGLAAAGDWQSWSTGYFPVVAGKIGGPWLAHAMLASALLSNLLLLTVTMLSASRVTLTMAQDRLLPSALGAIHPVRQTPSASLLVNAAAYSVLAFFDFQKLIFLNSIFQIANILLIYASLLAIRRRRPAPAGAFQAPLGSTGLILLMLPTCGLALVVGAEVTAPKDIAIVALAALAGGVLYFCRERANPGRPKLPRE